MQLTQIYTVPMPADEFEYLVDTPNGLKHLHGNYNILAKLVAIQAMDFGEYAPLVTMMTLK